MPLATGVAQEADDVHVGDQASEESQLSTSPAELPAVRAKMSRSRIDHAAVSRARGRMQGIRDGTELQVMSAVVVVDGAVWRGSAIKSRTPLLGAPKRHISIVVLVHTKAGVRRVSVSGPSNKPVLAVHDRPRGRRHRQHRRNALDG
jgi:hypothetical protein